MREEKMCEEKQEKVIQELQKQLEAHWKNTEKERKRTHSGKMYKKYMEEKWKWVL